MPKRKGSIGGNFITANPRPGSTLYFKTVWERNMKLNDIAAEYGGIMIWRKKTSGSADFFFCASFCRFFHFFFFFFLGIRRRDGNPELMENSGGRLDLIWTSFAISGFCWLIKWIIGRWNNILVFPIRCIFHFFPFMLFKLFNNFIIFRFSIHQPLESNYRFVSCRIRFVMRVERGNSREFLYVLNVAGDVTYNLFCC